MEAFYCRLRDQASESGYKDGIVGTAIDLQMVMRADPSAPGGVVQLPMVAVLWFKETADGLMPTTQPSPSFHGPEELQGLGLVAGQEWDEEEEEEEEEAGNVLANAIPLTDEVASTLENGELVTEPENNASMNVPPIQQIPTPPEPVAAQPAPPQPAVDPLSVPVTSRVKPSGSAPNSMRVNQPPAHLRR